MRASPIIAAFFCVTLGTLISAMPAKADPVRVIFENTVPDDIRAQIEKRLPDEADAESRLHARRKARRAAKVVAEIFNAYGYFDPTIETVIMGEGGGSRAELTISQGALFSIDRLVVRYENAPPRDVDQTAARDAISLESGEPAVAAKVLDQERQIASTLRGLGYPYAEVLGRDVIGDREAKTISVRYSVSSGPRVRFGRVVFPDGIRTRDSYLDRINPIEGGALFDPAELALYNSRLAETRLFDSSIAKLSDEPVEIDEDGTEVRDVELVLGERKRNTLTLGAGFDTNEGFGITGELLRRNLTRRGDLLVATARAAEREFGLDLEWRRPNEHGYGRGLTLFASATDENTDAFNQKTGTIGAGWEVIKGPDFSYSYGAEGRYIRQQGEVDRRDFQVLALNGTALLDKSDSKLDPRRGWRLEGQLKPTYAFSPDAPDGPYARAVASGRVYLPLSSEARYVAAARLRIGTLYGAEVQDVPADDRFYAGGGGSVRGYAFQAIGPFDATDTPLGGRSLLEASLEGRARITETIGGVLFLDAGNVSDEEYPTLDNLRVGLGAGIRYMTPAGPIRFDVATPLNPSDRDDAVQIYISIGQAF